MKVVSPTPVNLCVTNKLPHFVCVGNRSFCAPARNPCTAVINLGQPPTKTTLLTTVDRLWSASAVKVRAIERDFKTMHGAPGHTVKGRYATRGWTEWTQGFQTGGALLQYDATGEESFLELGRR